MFPPSTASNGYFSGQPTNEEMTVFVPEYQDEDLKAHVFLSQLSAQIRFCATFLIGGKCTFY